MKIRSAKTPLFLLMFTVAASLQADVIVNNLSQPTDNYFGPIGDNSNTNDFLIGQEFTLPAEATPYQLDQITLLLNATAGGANIAVSVWQVGPDNNPTNEIAVVASNLVANAGNVDFVPSTNISLSPGIYYVVAAPATPADSGFVSWAYTADTNWVGLGSLGGYADTSPGGWENASITNFPQQLRVQATPLPASISISHQRTNMTLSWSSALTGYGLEITTNLASPDWQTVTNTPTLVAGTQTITNRWSGSSRFFRLRQNIVADNLGQPTGGWDGPIGTDANSNDFLIGQEFALPSGSHSLSKITLPLNPVNGSGHVTVSLWHAGPDNNPTNEIAEVASQLVSSAGNINFVPSTPVTLPGGTYYVVAAPTTPTDNGRVGWDWTFSTSWTGFGTLGRFADTYPGAWENFPLGTGPYQMSIQTKLSPP